MNADAGFRILIIDDTAAIHDDYRKVLCASCPLSLEANTSAIKDMESLLFGIADSATDDTRFEIESAYQGEQGAAMLKAAIAEGRPFAMAFVDMRMPPGWDGVETIRQLWKIDPTLQIAICTAFSDYTPEQIAKSLRIDGRMLILRKPFDGLEARQVAITLCDKWQTRRSRNELQRAALYDALTGLPNRLLFADRLNQALLRGKRDAAYKFAVMFVDVDQFKLINDSFGHDVGDALLLEISKRLNQATRAVDTVSRDEVGIDLNHAAQTAARLGGDEFAILLDGIRSDADAIRVAERILTQTAKPYSIGGSTIHNSVSIGIATNARKYDRVEEIIRDADEAMYLAKRQGRGRVAVYGQTSPAAA